MTRDELLELIEKHAETDPGIIYKVTQRKQPVEEAVYRGVLKRTSLAMERAADMEAALAGALGRKSKATDELIRQKLEKWRGNCALKWDWYLDGEKKA